MDDSSLMGKIVVFGAGKIGRSFIGQLFSRGGYEVVFVDVFRPVIDELNQRKSYTVVIKSDNEYPILVENVRGIMADNHHAVNREIASADLAAVCVGLQGLNGVFKLLASALKLRYELYPDKPIDIILAENMRNADHYFRTELRRLLPEDYPLQTLVGLVETSIGKMVPIMTQNDTAADLLKVFAEPYNTLILDKLAFKNPIPSIDGLAPKENMKAWVDRKLFIHNLGHASAAYIGFIENPSAKYIYEVLSIPKVYRKTRAAMMQAASLLLAQYPDEFTKISLEDHIDDLLNRFQNKALGDTLFRVGCDLGRKLGPEDRLSGAIRAARQLHLPCNKILYALVCGFRFRATDENGMLFPADLEFIKLYDSGYQFALNHTCGFDPEIDRDLFDEVKRIEKDIE